MTTVLEHIVAQINESDSHEVQLLNKWRLAVQMERDAKAAKDEIRDELMEAMADGVRICDDTGEIVMSQRSSHKVDQSKVKEILGDQMFSLAAEVSTTKLKELVKAGILSQAQFDQMATTSITEFPKLQAIRKAR